MSETLKPCPFCGGEAEMLTAESMNGGYLFGIMCNDCRSRGDVYDTEAEAIAAWNTRMVPGEIETALVADGTAERAATRLARWWESCFREDKRQAERTKLQDDLTRYDNLIVHCPSCGAKVIGGDAE